MLHYHNPKDKEKLLIPNKEMTLNDIKNNIIKKLESKTIIKV